MTISIIQIKVTPTAPPAEDLSDPQPNTAGGHQRELQQGEIKINTYDIQHYTSLHDSHFDPFTDFSLLDMLRVESQSLIIL